MNGLVYAEKRKAVAPIIATLLMVAIAVVGGILIFVFTQGFFTDTETSSQSVDKIQITGYDFSDLASGGTLVDHTGVTFANSVGAVNGGIKTGDVAAIYIENRGETSANIRTIEIAGSSYGYHGDSSADTALSDSFPGAGKFSLCTASDCVGTAGDWTGEAAVLPAGATGTIVFEIDTSSIDIKNGRSVKMTIETDNGGISTLNAKVGKQRGS